MNMSASLFCDDICGREGVILGRVGMHGKSATLVRLQGRLESAASPAGVSEESARGTDIAEVARRRGRFE